MTSEIERVQLRRVTVLDADTIKADIQGSRKTIRLRGIDAPEAGHPIGHRATKYLTSLIRGGVIYAQIVDTDQYGRSVAWIYRYPNDVSYCLNVEMVRAGLAYAYRGYGGEHPLITNAERSAKKARRGVWQAGRFGGEKPWDYRNADILTRGVNWVGRSIGNRLFDSR